MVLGSLRRRKSESISSNTSDIQTSSISFRLRKSIHPDIHCRDPVQSSFRILTALRKTHGQELWNQFNQYALEHGYWQHFIWYIWSHDQSNVLLSKGEQVLLRSFKSFGMPLNNISKTDDVGEHLYGIFMVECFIPFVESHRAEFEALLTSSSTQQDHLFQHVCLETMQELKNELCT